MKMKDINLSDAIVKKVLIDGDSLVVRIEDWQEQPHSFDFKEVVGFQAFSPEGQELSHGLEDDANSFIVDACEAAQEESPEEFHCYKFISPWTEKSILTVVARSFIFR